MLTTDGARVYVCVSVNVWMCVRVQESTSGVSTCTATSDEANARIIFRSYSCRSHVYWCMCARDSKVSKHFGRVWASESLRVRTTVLSKESQRREWARKSVTYTYSQQCMRVWVWVRCQKNLILKRNNTHTHWSGEEEEEEHLHRKRHSETEKSESNRRKK